MKNRLTNQLFVMQAYADASVYGKVYPRNKQRAIPAPHGFVPNHVFNSGLTAGSDRRAREIREDYPEFFETIRRKEYYRIFKPKMPNDFRSNWELSRIKIGKIGNGRTYLQVWKELIKYEIEKYNKRLEKK